MDQVFNEIADIFDKNGPQNIKNKIDKYLDQYISFDFIRNSSNDDTLIHHYFRKSNSFPENLKLLLDCFYQCDHPNSDRKSPIHILLENCPNNTQQFKILLSKGISLFDSTKFQISIIELVIQNDNLPIFKVIFEYFSYDYISIYFDKILALIFQYEAMQILLYVISNKTPIFKLFLQFLSEIHLPDEKDDIHSANSQFFNAISNSKHRLFKGIFESLPNPKIVTIDMLYKCKTEEFCAFLYKYIKDGEFSKLQIKNNAFCSQKILSLIIDLKEGIYYSRRIIHDAVKQGNIDLIKQFPVVMLDSKDYKGNTPLIYAIKHKQNEIIQYLINSCECDFCHLGAKTTPLHLASQSNRTILQNMLNISKRKEYKFEFDINVKDRMGSTPLLAPFLITSNNNETPFINEQCLDFLVSNKADINICDSQGKNLLYYVFYYNSFFSIRFIQFCLTLNLKNETIDWNELLPSAIQNKEVLNIYLENFEINMESIKKMVSKGTITITPSIYTKMNLNFDDILDFLEICPAYNMINLILSFDDSILYTDKNNRNVLFILAKRCTSDFQAIFSTVCEKMLTTKNNDFLSIQNKETGDTFLHTAMKSFNMIVVDTLLNLFNEKKFRVKSHFSTDEIDFIMEQINTLFHIKNKDSLTAIELAASLNINLRNIFTLDVFQSKPSIKVLQEFLKKTHNPNYIEKDEPILFKYIQSLEFDEENINEILKIFAEYHCDFSISVANDNNNPTYAAKIMIDRNFQKGFEFLVNHGGAIYYSFNIALYLKINKDYPFSSIFKEKYKDLALYSDILDDFSKNYFITNIKNELKIYARQGIPLTIDKGMNEIIMKLYLPLYFDFKLFISMMKSFQKLFDRLKRKITFTTDLWKFFECTLPFVNTIVRNLIMKYVTLLNKITSERDAIPSQYSLNPITSGFCQIDRTFLMFRDNMKSLHQIASISIPQDNFLAVYKEWGDVLEDICIFWYESFDFNSIKDKRESIYRGSFIEKNNLPKILRTFKGKVASSDFEIYNTDFDLQEDQKTTLLVCFEKSIAFVDFNDSKMIFYYEEMLPIFVKYAKQSVDIYTKDGMIKFEQENMNSIRNFEKLNNEQNQEINSLFEQQWIKSDDSSETTIYICFVEASSKMVIQHQFEYNKKSSVEDVKQFGRKQIESLMLEDDSELVWMTFSLTPLL